jgi:tyrosyl-tRNA synthetase
MEALITDLLSHWGHHIRHDSIQMTISLLKELHQSDETLLTSCTVSDNNEKAIRIHWDEYDTSCEIIGKEYQLFFVTTRPNNIREIEFQLFESDEYISLAREIIKRRHGQREEAENQEEEFTGLS